jgi:hypothetical protein
VTPAVRAVESSAIDAAHRAHRRSGRGHPAHRPSLDELDDAARLAEVCDRARQRTLYFVPCGARRAQ